MSIENPERELLINNGIARMQELKVLLSLPVANPEQFSANAPYVLDVPAMIDTFRTKAIEVLDNLIQFIQTHRGDSEILSDIMLTNLLAKRSNAPSSFTFDYAGGTDLQHSDGIVKHAFEQALNQFNSARANTDLGTLPSSDWNSLLGFAQTSMADTSAMETLIVRYHEAAAKSGMTSEEQVSALTSFIYNYFVSIQTLVSANTKVGVDDLYGNIFNAFTYIFSYIMIMSTPPTEG
jgi:hypothetical protein